MYCISLNFSANEPKNETTTSLYKILLSEWCKKNRKENFYRGSLLENMTIYSLSLFAVPSAINFAEAYNELFLFLLNSSTITTTSLL
jgi:hypothetical protein